MEKVPVALDLSDVVHDESIGEDPHPGSPSDDDSHSPSAYGPEPTLISSLHAPYEVLDTQNRVQGSSVEMFELANLLHQNASAATAALLSAAAQQHQSVTAVSSSDAATETSVNDISTYLSDLAAVLQAAQAQAQVSDSDRIALDVLLSARDTAMNDKGNQSTRPAPSFHSLTAAAAEEFREPSRKRRRCDEEAEEDFLYAALRGESEGADGDAHGAPPQETNTADHIPSTEFTDINEILTQISTQFDSEPDRNNGSRTSHFSTSGSTVLAPSNRSAVQPVASTSRLMLDSNTSKKIKKPKVTKDKSTHLCEQQGCLKAFTRRSDLLRHMRIHTGERPFVCSHLGCGKTFIQRSALQVHFRVHTGEKPHCCEYPDCGKTFGDSSSLARHRRTHTGKRPYKCEDPQCEKTFTRRTTLIAHMRTHDPRWEPDPSVRYSFTSNGPPPDQEEDQELAESVRTISEVFQSNGFVASETPSGPDSLDRVASISAEIAAAIAQAHQRAFEEEEEEETDSEQEMAARETIGPNTSGIRGLGAEGQNQRESDEEVFPMPLRVLKNDTNTNKRKR